MKEDKEMINPMKELRQILMKTQQIFAKEVGIGKSTVSHNELGIVEISDTIQKSVAKKYNLNNNWYQRRNYTPKPNFQEIEKFFLYYIRHNIKDEQVASDILIAIKEMINIKYLSEEERKTYIRYIRGIMDDVKNISEDAKSYISKKRDTMSSDNAYKFFSDVISIYDGILTDLKQPININLTESEDVMLKFS